MSNEFSARDEQMLVLGQAIGLACAAKLLNERIASSPTSRVIGTNDLRMITKMLQAESDDLRRKADPNWKPSTP